MTIARDQLEFVRSPKQFATKLTSDPKAIQIGFRSVLAIALLYDGAILLWALGADGVTLPAFLRIPEQQYYLYELVFLIPIFFLTWLLAASIAYVASKALGGRGVDHIRPLESAAPNNSLEPTWPAGSMNCALY